MNKGECLALFRSVEVLKGLTSSARFDPDPTSVTDYEDLSRERGSGQGILDRHENGRS